VRVTLFRGELQLDGRPLAPGDAARVVDGRAEPAGPAEDGGLSTSWMLPLLRLRAEDGVELRQRAQALALQIDDPRIGRASELALRRMGADAAPALLQLMGQVRGVESAMRRRAAVLLADLAGPEHASRLARLLRDRVPEVRAEAARGLERLTGQTLGLDRSVWAGAGHERGAQAWDAWLDRHAPAWGSPGPPRK
jgi:HEAT repeat protein